MEYFKDFGIVIVVLTSAGFMVRWLLNGFRDHLTLLQSAWATEGHRLYQAIATVHADLSSHMVRADKRIEQASERLDLLMEEVSSVRNAFQYHIDSGSPHVACKDNGCTDGT